MEAPSPVEGWERAVDPLKYMKELHPVECAEFAKSRGIADESAFV